MKSRVVLLLIFSIASAWMVITSGCKHESLECDPEAIYFERDILPILNSNCALSHCHDSETSIKGIDFSSYEAMMASDDAVDSENPMDSELLERIKDSDPDDRMPYSYDSQTNDYMPGDALDPSLIRKIEIWLSMGAKNEKCYF
jgi:hypothetical protein